MGNFPRFHLTKDVAVHAHVLQLLGGLAIASVMGLLYMINRTDVKQPGTPSMLFLSFRQLTSNKPYRPRKRMQERNNRV